MNLINRLSEMAVEEIGKKVPDRFTDDWYIEERWFQFSLVSNTDIDDVWGPYRFSIKDDEELWGTPEEQLDEWLNERF